MTRSIWLAISTVAGAVVALAAPATAATAGAASSSAHAAPAAAVARPAATARDIALASTPPMGWNSFNAFACDNGAQNMEAVARFIHDSGLERDGYSYVNADGCYDDLEGLGSPNTFGVTAPVPQDPETCGAINGRLPDGQLFASSYSFPPSRPCANNGFALVGDRIHALGLKFGLYLDASNDWNCEEIPGSYGFDKTDAATLASYGADYVKLDWGCSDDTVPPASNAPAGYTGIDAAPGNQGFGGPAFATNPAYAGSQEATQIKMYTALGQAIRSSGRPMVVSVAGGGSVNSQDWGFGVGQVVRPTGDANANFTTTGKHAAGSVVGIINADAQTYDALTGPGHWVDPDGMEIGNGSLTLAEDQSEMSMFSEMADPLLMATNLCPAKCGPDTTPATAAQLAQDVSVFGNRRVIAVDQDRLGSPAHIVGTFDGTHLIMTKPLANGGVAVTLFNESTTDAATMSTTAAAAGLPAASAYRLQDLWSGQRSTSSGDISVTVPPTTTVMYRINAVTPASGAAGHAVAGHASPAGARAVSQPEAGAPAAHGTGALPASLTGVSCQSAARCTAVDNFGTEETFRPSGGSAAAAAIDPGHSLVGVSCPPGTTRCTALDSAGTALTFDPARTPGSGVTRRAVDAGNQPTALACMSATQCTVVDGKGNEVTFNPATGRVSAAGVTPVDPFTYLGTVSCPTATQCTAGGGGGNNSDTEVTFNPVTGAVGPAGVTALDSATVNGVSSASCPSAQQCSVVDGTGNELTFDPATGTPNAAGLAPLEGADVAGGLGVMTSVSCASATQCTAVDDSGNEVTFDPGTGTVSSAGVTLVDHAGGLQSVACLASGAQCTAVDLTGHQVTFSPATGSVTGSGAIRNGTARR